MNRLLAGALANLNAALAIFIILAAVVVGAAARGAFGLLVGALFGFAVALLVCGALAVVLDIRASLREIAHALKRPGP
jgi:hypothetical protein